ncbi:MULTISPECIES: carbohydrate kinase family protein [Clostridium]|uniref:Carbohydrate kinase family protein n=1 Tax=Clostridium cibarium TaxID=2762247 RepID=A0ABR8PS98_9CLOT|nr:MULTISPECIES: carbohydrate kinase family protein [Clostridium]MBD7910990.1 carbohydrate kinase family protein [Clostridium cibarium]
MKNILVAGLINIETTIGINQFPIEYTPIDYKFFGLESTVSGVGYNVAKALKTLGAETQLLSLIGRDMYEGVIKGELKKEGIGSSFVKATLSQIPQSVVLYDDAGTRKIYLDLKDIQDKSYPFNDEENMLDEVDLVVACNINFSRDLLEKAKRLGKLIASDVHVISNIEDEYNKDYMAYADILFLSNENILGKEEEFIKEIAEKYENEIIVIGMGSQGTLLYVKADAKVTYMPAVNTRKIVSTIGAGDALFSSFIYFYCKDKDPYDSLKKAIYFASYKIGEKGAASGFLSEKELINLIGQ